MKLTKSRLSKEFSQSMRDHYHREKWSDVDFDTFSEENVFLITVPFFNLQPDQVMPAFRKMTYYFVNKLVGPHPGKRRHLQPYGYAFVDFEGTRHGYSRYMNKPHIHAVVMRHPITVDRFDRMMGTEPILQGIKRFDPLGDPLEGMMSYSMKGVVGETKIYHGRKDFFEPMPFGTSKSKFAGGRQS